MAGNAALDEERTPPKPWVRREKVADWTEWAILATLAITCIVVIVLKLVVPVLGS